jgi:hypothetical protein
VALNGTLVWFKLDGQHQLNRAGGIEIDSKSALIATAA